ncbi:NAD-dependent epimerase/dehydratase family protein [Mucilaginibacter sabulilitoris]|uniref:NAD-dependent epimerase/dehydratase family protein n=1 Tax=Mucilaginibacter sabulilitoris TaxID=1173583 RepID=A0ABZ0TVS4_9SPHI|nr:NAD-dependent epimerase/dehydratase family protein [Mucilaginibacter sabulilitoris]WPU95899.1 NAD-dependent epimerase/dehydratase family protein [Mucilaginibacter sabulilitoris]
MHTILGAGGPVANALTKELVNNNETVRLVSRKPVKITGKTVTWQKADLLNYDEILAAAQGSTVIYLTAGLVYDKEIWRQQWPVIIQNVINVTKATGARLIFFDNVYMYGLVNGSMTEDTPYHPSSVKGQIRAGIANTIMAEVKAGNIRGTIARAPDFYGTDSTNSFIDMMVLSNYAKKKAAQWIGNPDKKHNYIYIPDAGKAMFLLGQNPDSDNQIWHLPTAPAVTGRQFLDIAAAAYGVKPKYMRIRKFMLWIFGLFKKVIMGAVEMYYQFDHDYIFDSSKFEKAFNFKPTSYAEGIKTMSQSLYKAV